MKAGKIKSLILAVFGCFYALSAYSAVSLFSDYGQIQNVQNYSTNPFWSPNSPYNQRMPQPVYVQGNDTTTDECVKILQSAVAFQCSARNNCVNTALSDIRPAIIVQLSNLPGKAYGTACAGYLDTVFESYVAQFGNYAPTKQVAFPSGSNVPNPSINNNNNTIQIKNPYEIKTPQWQQEINERSRELQELQEQNGAGNEGLSATAFPTTYKDLSFSERMANEAAGYAPYKDKSAYQPINVKSTYDWCKDHQGSKECAEYEKKTTHKQDAQNKSSQLTNKSVSAAASDIVKLLQPENAAQEAFFSSLAAEYVEEKSKKASLVLDNQFIYDFFSTNIDRITTFKAGLQNLESKQHTQGAGINIDWQEAVNRISTLLDDNKKLRGAMICENNRSYQVGIDVALWTATTAATVATFWAGGAGGAASAAAATAAKAGLKTVAAAAIKGALKAGIKYAAIAAAGGIIIKTMGTYSKSSIEQTKFSKSSAGLLYSLVDSEPRTDVVNCQGLDLREGCYTVCGQAGTPNDDLNTKVLYPVMGKNYCINPEDFTLYDANNRKPLMMDAKQYAEIRSKLTSIQNKGNCDWNEDDIDMFLGPYIYDSNTMEPSSYLLIEEVVRLDD